MASKSPNEYEVLVGINVPPNDTRYDAGTIISSTCLTKKDAEWMLRDNVITPYPADAQQEALTTQEGDDGADVSTG